LSGEEGRAGWSCNAEGDELECQIGKIGDVVGGND